MEKTRKKEIKRKTDKKTNDKKLSSQVSETYQDVYIAGKLGKSSTKLQLLQII